MTYALVEKHDPEKLADLSIRDDFAEALEQDGEGLDPIAVPHIIRDTLRLIKAARIVSQSESDEEIREIAVDYIYTGLMEIAGKYGKKLEQAYQDSRAYCLDADFEGHKSMGQPTLANFHEIEAALLEAKQQSRQVRSSVSEGVEKQESPVSFRGAAEIAEAAIAKARAIPEILKTLTRARERFYGNPTLRLLLQAQTHCEHSRALKDGALVVEGEMVTNLMNAMHLKVYGRKPKDALGFAFGGPPGWGKTVNVTHYIKEAIGVEPISIDINEGQNAFTLLATPILVQSDSVGTTVKYLDHLDSMSYAELVMTAKELSEEARKAREITTEDLEGEESEEKVKQLRAKLGSGLVKMKTEQMAEVVGTMERRGLFFYGPIYLAMERNVPVIINEVQCLENAEFLHSLATAIPATDEEAGEPPSFTPTLGQSSVKTPGWFFSTITSRWMRVPDKFRIFFTGNIGQEFDNQGLPGALADRLDDRFIEMPKLPVKEQVSLAWKLCSDDDGVCQLTSGEGAKLYFLLTKVFPHMEKMGQNESGHQSTKKYISIRTIQGICAGLYPQGAQSIEDQQQTKVSFEEALFNSLINPAIANRRMQALSNMLAVLSASRMITKTTMDRVERAMPSVDRKQLRIMTSQSKGGGGKKSAAAPKFSLEGITDRTFDDECVVCSMCQCPAHAVEVQEEVEELKFQNSILKIGLDSRVIHKLLGQQQKLIARSNWEWLLHAQTSGLAEAAKLGTVLNDDQKESLARFVTAKLAPLSEGELTVSGCEEVITFLELAKKSNVVEEALQAHKGDITRALQLAIETCFAAFQGEEGDEKKKPTTLNDNQLRMLFVIKRARALGYGIRTQDFEGAMVQPLIASLKSVTKKIMRKPDAADMATYATTLQCARTLFSEELDLETYLREEHLSPESLPQMFTIFSTMSSGRRLIDPERTVRAKTKMKGRPFRVMKSHRQASLSDTQLRSLSLEAFMSLATALEAWGALMANLNVAPDQDGDQVKMISKNIRAWLLANKDHLLVEGHLAPYLELVCQLARVQGQEIQAILTKVVTPVEVKVPPMRVF